MIECNVLLTIIMPPGERKEITTKINQLLFSRSHPRSVSAWYWKIAIFSVGRDRHRLRRPPAACTGDKRVKMHARAAQIIGQIASPLLLTFSFVLGAHILRWKSSSTPFAIFHTRLHHNAWFIIQETSVISPCARICFLFLGAPARREKDAFGGGGGVCCAAGWSIHLSSRAHADWPLLLCPAIYPTTCVPHIRTFMVHTRSAAAAWRTRSVCDWVFCKRLGQTTTDELARLDLASSQAAAECKQ
jgi:hypothetical protein